LKEVEELLGYFGVRKVPTVYIGGGTPSVLGAAGLDRFLGGLAELLPGEGSSAATPGKLRADECTLEVNPESVDEGLLRVCRDRGITRLSLGIQSFHEPSRRAVHRVGAGTVLEDRLALIAAVFGDNFSADLITGLPFQDEAILLQDIEKLLRFGPGHVSLYALTVEADTPLAAAGESVGLVDRDEADRLWLTGRDALEKAGYAQYEVSNFSRPGKEGRHNIRYWHMKNWLGVGPGASGTIIDDATGTGLRYTIPPDLDPWLAGGWTTTGSRTVGHGVGDAAPLPAGGIERLDRFTLMEESLLMGFRYLQGPARALFERRFQRRIEDLIPNTLHKWAVRGLLRQDRCTLTPAGLLFLNAFLSEAFEELDRIGAIHDIHYP
jgi:oxygen-independent coproporphyrinogen-3 oxidase